MPKIRHAATAVGDVNPDIGILADSEFAQGTGCRTLGNAEDKGAADKILNKIQPVIGTPLVVYLVRRLCFGPGERLLLQA